MSALKKRPRSLSLTPEIEDKLLKLCEQLGVNPHAYLLNEVGKCVNRDYLAFQTAANQTAVLQSFMSNLEQVFELEQSKPKPSIFGNGD